MAIYKEDIVDIELQGGNIHRSFMNRSIGSGDVIADRFGVRVFRNGEPVNLAGSTCSGYFVRADGSTVGIQNGTVEGNKAYVTLPAACYAIEGNFSLAIKCTLSGATATIRIVDGVVSRTSTDQAVDPGTIIPSVEALIDLIESTAASIPPDYSKMGEELKKMTINEYMANNIEHTENGVTFDAEGTRIKITGQATGNAGINVLDNKNDSLKFYLVPGETYHIHLQDVDWGHKLIITAAYRDSQYGQATEVLSIDTSTLKDGVYDDEFIVPATYYQFFISVTALSGWSYNEDFMMSIQNKTVLHDIASNDYKNNTETRGKIENIKIRQNETNYDLSDAYLYEDGQETVDGVTIDKKGTSFYIKGTSTATGAYKLIESAELFEGGDEIFIDFENSSSRLYIQVIITSVSDPSQHALLSTNEPGHYKITFPDDLVYVRIAVVYLTGTEFNDSFHVEVGRFAFEGKRIFYTSQNEGSLIKTVKEAERHYGSIVILDSQEYDLVDEFIDYYGEEFFTEYTTAQPDGWGLTIGNGMTLRGYTDAVINCDCSAYDAQDVYFYFSPLMLSGDCTLDNLTINAKNCKYCVHDDWFVKSLKAKHEYKNCKMYKNGRGVRCIGGGFTNAMEVVIKDCIFEMANGTVNPVHYHNCVNSGAISRGILSGCYFKTGYPGFSNYGASSLVSQFIVTNNSFAPGSPDIIVPTYEDQEHYPNVNMEVIQFNNTVRQS